MTSSFLIIWTPSIPEPIGRLFGRQPGYETNSTKIVSPSTTLYRGNLEIESTSYP